jgi:hypothetical protein
MYKNCDNEEGLPVTSIVFSRGASVMPVEACTGRVGFGNSSSEAREEGVGTEGLEVASSRCLILTGLGQCLRALQSVPEVNGNERVLTA